MRGVDTRGMDELDRALSDLLKEFPQMRWELRKELAALAKQETAATAAASGVDDSARQAAARAAAGGNVGPSGPGAGAGRLESGHEPGAPSSETSGRPRAGGLRHHGTARTSFEAKAIRRAESFADGLAERLEGGG